MQSVLLKLAFVHALCQMVTLEDQVERQIVKEVELNAWNTLISSHGTIQIRKLQKLTLKLNKFCKEMQWERFNIQAALNFSILLIEDIFSHIKDENRKKTFKDLIDSLNKAYFFFTEKEGEKYDLIEEGLKANILWKELVEN